MDTYRMVACCEVTCWAAHRHKNLVIYCAVGYVSEVINTRKGKHLPCTLEKFPVQGTRRHVECTGIDDSMTAYFCGERPCP
jgi:hypothetical protein